MRYALYGGGCRSWLPGIRSFKGSPTRLPHFGPRAVQRSQALPELMLWAGGRGRIRLVCQAVFRLIETDPPAEQVQRVTFVPFLPDGRCVLIERPEGPGLPAGEVLDGEDYLIETVLRVPLQTAGCRTGQTGSGWATRSTGSRRTASASTTCTSCSTACRGSVVLT